MYRSVTCYIRGLSKAEYSMLREMCRYANNLYNKALYEVRQHYFATGKYLRYEKNYHICKLNENFKMLATTVAMQTLRWADATFRSFFALARKVKEGEYDSKKLRLPRYREKGKLAPLTVQVSPTTCSMRHGYFTVPQSLPFWREHGKHRFRLKLPEGVDASMIREVKIIPVFNGRAFKVEYCYECEAEVQGLNPDRALGVDLGINNLAACVDSDGATFLLDGRRVKSINHYWNQRKAKLQSVYAHQGLSTGRKLQLLTIRRNEQIRDIMRKTARYIMNYCREHNIGTLVVGTNLGWKDKPKLSKPVNQTFTDIPHRYLRQLLRSHCERWGMTFIEQEESYTSKASFLDGDPIPTYGDKAIPEFSGVRVKRGLYRSSSGRLINADINGAANILRKSKQKLNSEQLCRELMRSPARIRIAL